MTLKTPIIEVKWGTVTYTSEQIRNVSVQLSKDGKSSSCIVQLTSNVDIPARGSPIGILIYYSGSPYEFYATFSHVGTSYAVGNDQYLEIKGGSLLWNSANQTPQNKQYFSGDNAKTVNLRDFLVKFSREKFKKEILWQAEDSSQSFSYVSQNGETDLAFFERVLKSYNLVYNAENGIIIVLDKNKLVDRTHEDPSTDIKPSTSTESSTSSSSTDIKPRVIYVDVGSVQSIIREFQPDSETSSSSGSSTDSKTSANSSNSPVVNKTDETVARPDPSKINSTFNESCTSRTYSGVSLKSLTDSFPNIKKKKDLAIWKTKFASSSWKNDPCLVYFAIQDVARQLQCSPIDLCAIGCFESEWNGFRSPNSIGCVGSFQCCPTSSYCGYGSQKAVYDSGLVGQVYAIGFLLADTIDYQKVQKPIPLVNLYAGVNAGGYFRVNNKDGANTPTTLVSSKRFVSCLKEAADYIGKPVLSSKTDAETISSLPQSSGGGSATSASSSTSSSTSSSASSSTSSSTSSTTDSLPFKCRLTVDMSPRFTGVKSGDLLVIPSDNYTGTEDFLIESVNYQKNGSNFSLQITGGRPIAPQRLAQDAIYDFVKEINTLDKYLKYLWGS